MSHLVVVPQATPDPAPRPVRPRAWTGRRAVFASVGVVSALVLLNVLRHVLPAGTLWFAVGGTVALLAIARWSGLTWSQLGLSRDRVRCGLLWGGAAVLAVAAVYLVGLLVPVTRAAFLDARYQLEASDALLTAFLVIPVGTVLVEEVAFRSVLWGMLARHMTTMRTLLVSSTLFGVWHVLPSLDFAASRGLGDGIPGTTATVLVVLGTVAFTAIGGAVTGELRRRSGSVLASAGMHWATNALGVLFGLVAWQLVT